MVLVRLDKSVAEFIKIFGERNTSTRALVRLIKGNSKSTLAPLIAAQLEPGYRERIIAARENGTPPKERERMIDQMYEGRTPIESWKHAMTDFDDVSTFRGSHVIFCVRHPASWALGLYRRPYHIHGNKAASLREFLDKRWKTVARERCGGAETTAIETYNLKIASYIMLQAKLANVGATYSFVRHEDFAVDQEREFVKIAPYLQEVAPTFQPLSASTKDPAKTLEYYRDYYGKERWRAEIDEDSNDLINERVNWAAIRDFGYFPAKISV